MLRDTLKAWLVRAVEGSVESRVRAATEPLADRVARLELRAAELGEELERTRKKLSMATGAVQACTADLQKVRAAAEQSGNVAQQAMQRATSALAAAEAAAEGVAGLEAHAAEDSPAPARRTRSKRS
jgi:hypothetical protein